MHTISDYQRFVETEIHKLNLPVYPAGLYEPVRYMMGLGGKRIRPVLTLLSNDLFGGSFQEAIHPALAMEVFHNFTLVHDDLMDKAHLRRGRRTVHEKWNQATAVLSGDVMLVMAYNLLINVKKEILPEVLAIFNETAMKVCEGQQLDMAYENAETISLEQYIEMIGLKTAALLGGCLKMGALLSGSSNKDRNAIYEFGHQAGIAFQVQDDLLDAFGRSADIGKNIGGDIASNKKTFLTVKAFEIAHDEMKEELSFLFGTKEIDAKSKICKVLAIYDALNIKKHAEKARDTYYENALKHLNLISVSESRKQVLRELTEMLINRNN
jgi:geranylgeranyl diphosphate synthase, type II